MRTIHNTTLWPGRRRVAAFVERRLTEFTPVAISEASRAAWLSLRAAAGLPSPGRVALIRNGAGLDPAALLPRGAAREALGLQPDAPTLGFVGRLAPQKGVDVLAQAVASRDWPPGARLEVFGDGPLRPALEAARAAGAPVRLHGARPDVGRLYLALDGLLAPSRFEGAAPLAVLEALVAGLPVAAYPCPGIIDDPTTAERLITIDELTPSAICTAAARVLASAGTATVARDLSESAMCASYVLLYNESIARLGAATDGCRGNIQNLPHSNPKGWDATAGNPLNPVRWTLRSRAPRSAGGGGG